MLLEQISYENNNGLDNKHSTEFNIIKKFGLFQVILE